MVDVHRDAEKGLELAVEVSPLLRRATALGFAVALYLGKLPVHLVELALGQVVGD